MKLGLRYMLFAAATAGLLLLVVGAARFTQPRAAGIQPKPVLAALNPDSIAAGSPGFTLTVNGAFFVKSSVVQWNGEARATTVVSDTVVRAEIRGSDVASPGNAAVTVLTPALLTEYPGVSNALTFRIVPGNPF